MIFRFLFGSCLFLPLSGNCQENDNTPTIVVRGESLPREATRKVTQSWLNAGTQSVTDLTKEELDQVPLPNPTRLFSRAPNASGASGGGRTYANLFSIRGISNSIQISRPSVSLYLDGVPLVRTIQFPSLLLSPTQAQIFRGPQALSFGQSSEAGTFVIETESPGEVWSGNAEASYASREDERFLGLTGGPLAKGLYGQVGGFYTSEEGSIHNPFLNTMIDPREASGGQAKIIWHPAEQTEIAFLFWREQSDDGAARAVPLGGNPFIYASDEVGTAQTINTIGALRLKYEADTYEITCVVSGQWFDLNPNRYDTDFTPAPLFVQSFPIHDRAWIGEFTIASKADPFAEIGWRAGLTAQSDQFSYENARSAPLLKLNDSSNQRISSQRVDLFGMLSVPLSPQVRVWGGVRAFGQWEQAMQDYTGPLAPNQRLDDSRQTAMALPEAGIEWKPDAATLVYGKCGTGSKPAGLVPFVASSSIAAYDTEYLVSGEVGFKKSWMDEMLSVQGSVFYYSVEDYQFESRLSSGAYSIFNIPETTGTGGEMECIVSPWRFLQVGVGAGFTKTTVQEGKDPVTGNSIVGNQLPYAPLFNVSTNLTFRPYAGWILFVEGLVVGTTYSDLRNSGQFEQSSYGIVNLKAGYEWKHAAIYFTVDNVADEQYYSLITPSLGPAGVGIPGDPQSFGVRVTARF